MESRKKLIIFGLVTTLLIAGLTPLSSALSAKKVTQLLISAPSSVMEDTVFAVSVYVRIDGNGSGNTTFIPISNATITGSWGNCTYYTNSYGIAYLTSPSVAYNRNFSITASKAGFLSVTTFIMVIDYSVPPNHAPYVPSNPSPSNFAGNVSVYTLLMWTGGDPDAGDQVTYDVYFGRYNGSMVLVASNLINGTYNPGLLQNMSGGHLAGNTQYFWRIVSHDNHNHTTMGPVWCFRTYFYFEPTPFCL
jgi:hypothetical protein